MSTTQRVFVYGTLMRGEHHHGTLGDAQYVGPACTRACYRLVWMEYYPALLPGGTQMVRGEVYQVSGKTLSDLDELEEHPDVYVRQRDTLEGGSEAFLYVLRPEQAMDARPIASGDFRDLPPHQRRPQTVK